ncbi:universal stress protein [Thermococcus sp.]|uniref:universal stress protein n=1 Tax=Thermococcus sp. TaxID=35749 RepID=UPI00262CECCC|nr:universal stress protein [Thermococcus sp.]
MFERILYPTDFSGVSLHALRHCIPELFKAGARELHLIHVIDITVVEFEAFELEGVFREKLEDIARGLRERDISVKTHVTIGIPSIEIARTAQSENVDLIVTPSIGENAWRQMFMGSTASNLARTTKKSVLLLKYVRKDESFKLPVECSNLFRKPLVAVDFSKCSLKVAQVVRKFLEHVESGILIHSVDYGGVNELEHNIEVANKNLEKLSRGLGGRFTREVMVGTASQAIIGTALARGSTMIVLGKKGRSVLKDLILGSTAERVIRDSKLPVLLVPCD